MYIVNPLQREGLQAADWTSTHPPISERVRILRSMGGAAFADYNSAFGKVRGRPIIPPSALETGAGVAKREAQAAETQKERAGKVNDFFWKLGNYMFLTCGCGTVLKVPPDFRAAQVRCPHCSAVHPSTEFHKAPGNVPTTDAWEDVPG
jgi:heat shock protein HtpX